MSDLRDRINELIDDAKTRVYNPLILSFLLVWFYFHWKFIYEVFTINDSIDVLIRSGYFQTYVKKQGWCGMIGYPLMISVISLIVFYLLRIVGTIVKVLLGQTLFYYIISKLDKSSYVSVTKYREVKDENRELRATEENQNEEIKRTKSLLRQKEKEVEGLNADAINKAKNYDDTIGALNAEKAVIQQEKTIEINKHQEVIKDTQNLREQIRKLEIEKETLIKSNDRMEQNLVEISLINEKLNKGNKITRDIEAVFPENSRWSKTIYEPGKIPRSEEIGVINGDFLSITRNITHKISGFQFDKENEVVTFTSNENQGQDLNLLETKLVVLNFGQLLSGGEGKLTITYIRID